MGRSQKQSESRITVEQTVRDYPKLSHKVVYVLEFSFNELTKEDTMNIGSAFERSRKPVPDLSSVIIDKMLDPETRYHIKDIRKSVLEYNKLSTQQKSATRNLKRTVFGTDAYILEVNSSNNIMNEMSQGNNLFFVKFYIESSKTQS